MILMENNGDVLEENGTPLYRQVAERLRGMIAERQLAPGAQLPPTRELQRYFNVSAITVESGIRLLVKERCLRRRPRLGTFVCDDVSAAAEDGAVAVKRIRVIFCYITPRDLYWSVVWDELASSEIFNGGDRLFALLNRELAPADFDRYVSGCDGVVLCGYTPLALVEELERRGVPFAMIGGLNCGSEPPEYVDAVGHDDVHRAYISTRHLLELGHRSIVCVAGPTGSRLEEDVTAGYRQAMTEYGVSEEGLVVERVTGHTIEEGLRVGLKVLTGVPRPTAVYACDDRLAIGIHRAAGQMGFRVPEDLSLIGCGGLELGRVIAPALTSMPSHPRRSARIAMEKLSRQFADPDYRRSQTVLRFDELSIGGSTRVLRTVQNSQPK